jgi:acyltransferase-like protein
VESGRDPVIDTVRAVAVVGVVLGHWLVTSLVAESNGMSIDSPLRSMPGLAPVSWFLQTLGLFFFVGGFSAARSHSPLPGRIKRVAIAVGILLGVWLLILAGLWFRGLPQTTLLVIVHLLVTPLWFIGVYVLLSALTPAFRFLDRHLGLAAVLIPVLLVLVVDPGPLDVLAVWWAPWQLGIATARTGMRRTWGLFLLLAGAAGFFIAIHYFGYSAGAVGMPGERSNLAPPTPAALTLALAQIGLVLLIQPKFGRTRHVKALPIFLTHQSALLAVTLIGSVFGPLPGLHTAPTTPAWLGERLLWLPVFGLVTWVLLRDRRRQRQHDRAHVQDHPEGVRLQDQQRWHAGHGGEQPRPSAVAGPGAGHVQQVPPEQQVDEVLQRVHLQHDQGGRRAREPRGHEPEHPERAESDAQRGR